MAKLEKIQRYFSRRVYKRVFSGTVPDYQSRLKLLGLISLVDAFKRSDMLTLYKLMYHRMPSHSFTFRCSSRHPHRILISRIRTNIARKHFTNRASCLWNRVVAPDSVTSFHAIKEFLSSDAFLSAIDSRA